MKPPQARSGLWIVIHKGDARASSSLAVGESEAMTSDLTSAATASEVCDLIRMLGGIAKAFELDRAGINPSVLRRECATGVLVRPQRGTYAIAQEWRGLRVEDQHRLLVTAAARIDAGALFCGPSAAAVYGIPLLRPVAKPLHVLVSDRAGGRSSATLRRHQSIPDEDERVVSGVRVTGLARTLIDIARCEPFASAIVAVDYALHQKLIRMSELNEVLAVFGERAGVRRARWVLRHANEDSESVGESLSRARFIENGFQVPKVQQPVRGASGKMYWVDFYWEGIRLAGEFDGHDKYVNEKFIGKKSQSQIVEEERRRENDMRNAGEDFARWTWDEALRGGALCRILTIKGVPRTSHR